MCVGDNAADGLAFKSESALISKVRGGKEAYILALVASSAVMLTDIQSPGLTRSPSIVNAASGYHSHHAEALWPPFELTYTQS